MHKVSKEDRFRLELLEILIKDFLQGEESFDSLPYKIKSLHSCLSTLHEKDIQKIFEYWGDFEQIYAWMLNEDRTSLTTNEEQEVQDTATKFYEYLNKLLNKYPKEPEDPYSWPFAEYK